MAQLRIVMSADEAKAYRAYQKMIQKEKELGQAGEERGRKGKRGADESRGAMDRLAGSAQAYVTGLMGAGGVALFVRASRKDRA